MFRNWLRKKSLGLTPVDIGTFKSTHTDAILDASDHAMMEYAKDVFTYNHPKGLDFMARFNGTYIIGEAKFLTDFGGHQNAQFNDAMGLIQAAPEGVVAVAIIDGVPYINNHNKMRRSLAYADPSFNIMSALVLREFLYSL